MTRTKSGTVYEVSIQVGLDNMGNLEILKGLLFNIGIKQDAIIECAQFPYTHLSFYFKSKVKAASIQTKLRSYHLKNISLSLKTLKRKDWQTKWKEDFKPFALTKSFGVIPMAYRDKHRFRSRTPIYIDTDLAFGTGLHATTRFMAQFIERQRGRFKSFLDLGTGSGILSIIAEKCGASDITAIDISKEAIKVARRNALKNNCRLIRLSAGDAHKYRVGKQYDFVAANIITQDLIRMGDRIIRLVKPGKYLAVSGISLISYEIFRKAYAQYPLRCVKIEKGEGWVALLYKKLN